MKEEVRQYIDRCYRQILLRPVDPSGLETYGRLIEGGGIKCEELPKLLMGSIEYKQRFGSAKPGSIPFLLHIKPKKLLRLEHIAYISTWQTSCGIAEYTRYLTSQLPLKWSVYRYPNLVPQNIDVIHIQHEFGILPNLNLEINQEKFIVLTWHSVCRFSEEHKKIALSIDVHVVHTQLQRQWLTPFLQNKPIFIIPHGSTLWNSIPQEKAKKTLGLSIDKKIVFVFGFSNQSKGYEDIALLASKVSSQIPCIFIISAAPHSVGVDINYMNRIRQMLIQHNACETVKILETHLSDEQINLYADASDVLLFNYKGDLDTASASGAVHRIIAAGKPIVCSNQNRLIEFTDLAFMYRQGDLVNMEKFLVESLTGGDKVMEYIKKIRAYAEATTWSNVAKMHMEMYKSFLGK